LEAYRDDTGAAAEWSLTPDDPLPSADTRSLPIHVFENLCNSGEDAVGRVQEPRVEYFSRRILVTFWVTPRGGFQTCPSNPPTPFTLELDEPLGDRKLVDAHRLPMMRRFPDGKPLYR
ncbi:MAG: hypothetical protein ACR2N5_02415, partial [Solirubrobacterales bacterium]